MIGKKRRRSSSSRTRKTDSFRSQPARLRDTAAASESAWKESTGMVSLACTGAHRPLGINPGDDAFDRGIFHEQITHRVISRNSGDEVWNAHPLRIEGEVEPSSLTPDELQIRIAERSQLQVTGARGRS